MENSLSIENRIDKQPRDIIILILDKDDPEKTILEAIQKCLQLHGDVRHVWINDKDILSSIISVGGYLLERKGGCARGRVMVF